MESNCHYIAYHQTGYFSKIALDYIAQHPQLQPFYIHPVSKEGMQQSIKARQSFNTNRQLLVDVLQQQYQHLSLSVKQQANIASLANNNTFTLTTAHQPNIFTGPLYFIYKIMHVIKLADELKQDMPAYNFVPVYYMGSEDADLDELGYVHVGGQKLTWNTNQTGAVGRMKVDKALLEIINAIHGQAGVHPYGEELIALFKQCYTIGRTIQEAALELVNTLFADYGLLVVIPDNAALKQSFNDVVQKELLEQFSHQAVAATIASLSEHYKVQAGGRDINLFYLADDKRERIELEEGMYKVKALGLHFTQQEILNELQEHPERFSANVILRGVFQETILPNIAFIGGGGELAYWLELKKVFAAVQVPYPMLVLRNSFVVATEQQQERAKKLGFSLEQLFKSEQDLLNELVQRSSNLQLNLEKEIEQAKAFYQHIKHITGAIDTTLQPHTEALQTRAIKLLVELEKKMLRAEKRKFRDQHHQLQKLRNELFPNNSLQERTDNFSLMFAIYGKHWLQAIYKASHGLRQEVGIVVVK